MSLDLQDVSAEVLNAEGKRLFKNNNTEEAIQAFEKASHLFPQHPESYNNLGVIACEKRDLSLAIKLFEKALSVNPFYADAVFNRLGLVQTVREYSTLQPLFEKYLDKHPTDWKLRQQLIPWEEAYFESLLATSTRSDLNYQQKPYAVTAIVSTYSSEAFMRQCLMDLEAQTISKELEIIVVDANSPESEARIVKDFQAQYTNIRYLKTKDRIKIYTAWNVAMYLASGQKIAPFSTNDRLKPNAYFQLAQALDSHPQVDMVYGDTLLTSQPHQEFDSYTPSKASNGAYHWENPAFPRILYECQVGPHPMWRKSLHHSIGYFDERYKAISDQDYFIRTAYFSKILHIPVVTGMQWISESSISSAPFSAKEIFDIHMKYQAYYLKTSGQQLPPRAHQVNYYMFKRTFIELAKYRSAQEAVSWYEQYGALYSRAADAQSVKQAYEHLKVAVQNQT